MDRVPDVGEVSHIISIEIKRYLNLLESLTYRHAVEFLKYPAETTTSIPKKNPQEKKKNRMHRNLIHAMLS